MEKTTVKSVLFHQELALESHPTASELYYDCKFILTKECVMKFKKSAMRSRK